MKNTNKKRGFTIIELVIVVAVIAILTAVLVPTFAGVIRRANEAADTALIKNLNTALAADVDGCDTMAEALAAAADQGFDVARINAKASENKILWDSVNNVFCYEKDGKISYIPDYNVATKPADIDYWTIASTPSNKYSTYLYGASGAIVASVGIDVGNCDITSVTYNGTATAQNVTIVTNGGTLTINAPLDDITHYGVADQVVIEKVANSSYYENGEVSGFITLKSGHIVLDAKNNYEVKIDASASDIASGNVFVNVTATKGSVQLYADADVIQAVKNTGKTVFSGVKTNEAKSKDELQKISTVAELESIISQVNAGTLVNPSVYLDAGEYQFTNRIEINNSITITGVQGKTVLLGYYNPNSNSTSSAFFVKTTSSNQAVSFNNLVFKDFAIYKSAGAFVDSSKSSCSGILADITCDESTKINIVGCNFQGLNSSFINIKTGICTVANCVFDGTVQSYQYPNQIQIGDPNGVKTASATIDNCQFISSKILGEGLYEATAISPWGLTNLVITNCSFANCASAVSGGSEWYDYGSEYPKLTYSNCTFEDCVAKIQMQYWVDSIDDIPSKFDSYSADDDGTPGNYYYDGQGNSKYGVKSYRSFYTYEGNDSYTDYYIFWIKN